MQHVASNEPFVEHCQPILPLFCECCWGSLAQAEAKLHDHCHARISILVGCRSANVFQHPCMQQVPSNEPAVERCQPILPAFCECCRGQWRMQRQNRMAICHAPILISVGCRNTDAWCMCGCSGWWCMWAPASAPSTSRCRTRPCPHRRHWPHMPHRWRPIVPPRPDLPHHVRQHLYTVRVLYLFLGFRVRD